MHLKINAENERKIADATTLHTHMQAVDCHTLTHTRIQH